MKKHFKLLLYTIGIIIIILGIFTWLQNQKSSFNLSISVTPKEAKIKINGNEEGTGSIDKIYSKDIYKITVELEDYITDEREINLTENKKININLIKKLGTTTPPDKFRFKSTESSSVYSPVILNDQIITGYDKKLKMVFTASESTFTKIYTGDLEFYSFADKYILFGDKKVKDNVFVYSVNENVTTSIDTSSISPVIFASYNDSYDVLFLLGKYDPTTRTSNVYASKISESGFQLITSTTANSIEPIKDNLVVLFEKLDGNDASFVNILDLKTFKVVFSTNGNKYLISPSKKFIAVISSKKVSVVDLDVFSKKDIDYSKTDKLVWNDNTSFIAIHNKYPGVYYSYLETEFGEETSEIQITELQDKNIREIVGKTQDFLYLRDTEGAIWKIGVN